MAERQIGREADLQRRRQVERQRVREDDSQRGREAAIEVSATIRESMQI